MNNKEFNSKDGKEIVPIMEEIIKSGGQCKLRVTGYSMTPILKHLRDSVILTSPQNRAIKKGEIVFIQRDTGQYVLHRVLKIIDDETFDQKDFLKKVAACPECPKSACPSPERYMKAYECEADHIYAVTLSSELSGSYNSAVLGKSLFLEDNPGKKIHVFNSKSASGGESLIAMKIVECEEKGLSFEEVIETVDKYIEEMSTFFVLENLETLRKNGRLSRVKALVASALKIKPVMGSTPEGSICQLDQARGMNKAIVKMVEHVGEKGINIHEKTVAITYCNCPERAKMLEEAIRERLNPAKIVVMDTAGVSSMYANDGGVIVAV